MLNDGDSTKVYENIQGDIHCESVPACTSKSAEAIVCSRTQHSQTLQKIPQNLGITTLQSFHLRL